MPNTLCSIIMFKTFTDQMGRKVEVPFPPRRIVSIVPSQTELLFHLGLDGEVVGLTKFCIHPEEKWREKPRVGGTKKLLLDRIAELKPDLIIGNKEENERAQIEELEKHFPVWMSDIETAGEAFEMMMAVGEMTDKKGEAEKLVSQIQSAFDKIPKGKTHRAAYLIWRQPWMVAAGGTFINEMMKMAGLKNVFPNKTRYPEITLEELSAAKPEVVLLSSEPYPFQEKHFAELEKHCPEAVLKLVDGELFSWYGSRMLIAAEYFGNLKMEIGN